jgi:hypothetical protein
MKATTPAPALMSSADAERVVEERTTELAAVKADIARRQSSLAELANDEDDSKFESASLAIERLFRAKVRAEKRLEAAQEVFTEAKAREEQARRRVLFEAGTKAAAEADNLVSEYAKHAEQIADIFGKIDKLREPIEVANAALPDGEQMIDADHAIAIHLWTELPAAVRGREHVWWRGPLNATPEPVFVPRIVTAEPDLPQQKRAGPQLIGDNGARKYVMPPSEWRSPAQ